MAVIYARDIFGRRRKTMVAAGFNLSGNYRVDENLI